MFCYCFPARGQDKEKQRFSNWPQKKLKSKSLSPTHNPKKKKKHLKIQEILWDVAISQRTISYPFIKIQTFRKEKAYNYYPLFINLSHP